MSFTNKKTYGLFKINWKLLARDGFFVIVTDCFRFKVIDKETELETSNPLPYMIEVDNMS